VPKRAEEQPQPPHWLDPVGWCGGGFRLEQRGEAVRELLRQLLSDAADHGPAILGNRAPEREFGDERDSSTAFDRAETGFDRRLGPAAAAQTGEPMPGRPSYGRSLIVDPWGIVLAQAQDGEGVITAELEAARLEEVRARLPSLASRQPAAYRWPTPV